MVCLTLNTNTDLERQRATYCTLEREVEQPILSSQQAEELQVRDEQTHQESVQEEHQEEQDIDCQSQGFVNDERNESMLLQFFFLYLIVKY